MYGIYIIYILFTPLKILFLILLFPPRLVVLFVYWFVFFWGGGHLSCQHLVGGWFRRRERVNTIKFYSRELNRLNLAIATEQDKRTPTKRHSSEWGPGLPVAAFGVAAARRFYAFISMSYLVYNCGKASSRIARCLDVVRAVCRGDRRRRYESYRLRSTCWSSTDRRCPPIVFKKII